MDFDLELQEELKKFIRVEGVNKLSTNQTSVGVNHNYAVNIENDPYYVRWTNANIKRIDFENNLIKEFLRQNVKFPEYIEFSNGIYYHEFNGGYLFISKRNLNDSFLNIQPEDFINFQKSLTNVNINKGLLSYYYNKYGFNFTGRQVQILYADTQGTVKLTEEDGFMCYVLKAYEILPCDFIFPSAFLLYAYSAVENSGTINLEEIEGFAKRNDVDIDKFKKDLKEYCEVLVKLNHDTTQAKIILGIIE